MKRARIILRGVAIATVIVCLLIPVAGCGGPPKRAVRFPEESFVDIQTPVRQLLLDILLAKSSIAFVRENQIWVARGDGTEQKRLTDGFNACPAVSPDGRTIIYSHYDEDPESYEKAPEKSSGIYAIPSDGGTPKLLTPASWRTSTGWTPLWGEYFSDALWSNRNCFEPSFSSDGSTICFIVEDSVGNKESSRYSFAIATMNADGTGEPRISFIENGGGAPHRAESPRFSPDGSEIYMICWGPTDVGSWKMIGKIPAEGGELTRVTDTGYLVFGISGTRREIAAVHKNTDKASPDIPDGLVLMEMDGSNMRSIYVDPAAPSPARPDVYWDNPSFTPSGESIAFVASANIYVIPVEGGKPKQIITNGYEPCFGAGSAGILNQ